MSDAETVQVAAVAMHSAMGEPAANLDRVETWLRRARCAGATFAVFPEECITGSINKSEQAADAVLAAIDTAARLAVPRLETFCRELGMTAVVGTVERRGDRRFNSALVVGPDGYLATYDKMWLPGGEREYFQPGETLPVIDSQGWRFAVGICADLQRGDYFRLAADAGAEFFLLCVAGSGMPELVDPDGDQTKQAEAPPRAARQADAAVVGAERAVHLLRQPGRQEWSSVVSGADTRHRLARPIAC